MPERSPPESGALKGFLDQFTKDLEARVSRPLDEYLALFPGDSEHIAEEFLALRRHSAEVSAPQGDGMPAQVAHYRVIKEIGRGGQGIVYLAKDLTLGRRVAIKTLKRTTLEAGEFQRLQREARIASRLDHPGICPIYDIGDHRGAPYLVMRYVSGTTLAMRLHRLRKTSGFTFVNAYESSSEASPPAADRPSGTTETGVPDVAADPPDHDVNAVLRLIEHVARALHEAHEAGIIHRDIKPGNIMVTPEGQPVLLDFGVATMLEDGESFVTRTGETPGTPPYMSPEQASGKSVDLDRRTDVYSLGVTLYECLTLRLPFTDRNDIARQIMFVAPPDPRSFNPAIPRVLKTVLDTALEKDRTRRYPTAAELADDLRRVREHEPIRARPVGVAVRFARWTQRNPAVAASLLSTFLILVVALIFSLAAWNGARTAWESERRLRETVDHERSLNAPLADLRRVAELTAWAARLWPAEPKKIGGAEGMQSWLVEAQALIDRQPAHAAALLAFQFGASGFDAAERAACIRYLNELLPELSRLPGSVREMRVRLERASTIEKRTIVQHATAWADAAKELAGDARFAAISPLKPQLGLVPLGRNEAGLFEFALTESGVDLARRGDSKPITIVVESAAILVLMPGGMLRFDPDPDPATDAEPPPDSFLVPVPIQPFFIGKHEITQAQWVRIMGSNPSMARPGNVPVHVTERHPVENVNWFECSEFCRRLGVRLPTQDEWEYAARSTTNAEWGDCDRVACLEGRENLADQSYIAIVGRRPAEPMPWTDGFAYHAPIGSFLPNKFGLHDMLGNVAEWCGDVFTRPRLASSEVASKSLDEQRRVVRGSSWQDSSREANCRRFRGALAVVPQPNLGFRVARSVDP